MSYGTVQAEKMTTESGYSLGAGNASSFKNRIINGAMVLNQRGVVVTNPNPSYVTDRWNAVAYGSATVEQSSTAPTGFTNSLLWTTTTASAPSAGQWSVLNQGIEGFNVADLGWGAAGAQTVTLSFWVRSNTTGTYSVGLGNPTITSNLPSTQARSYVATYTVNAANTWEQKTITITGDTTGTWLKTNGLGLCITFDCGSGTTYQTSTLNSWQSGAFWRASGSVGIANTSSGTLAITGVQLEVGTVATSFDFRSYGTELALCQRYALVFTYDANNPVVFTGYWGASTTFEGFQYFPVPMRTQPSLSVPTIGSLYCLEAQVAWRQASSISIGEGGPLGVKVAITAATNTTFVKGQGGTGGLRASGTVQFLAEL